MDVRGNFIPVYLVSDVYTDALQQQLQEVDVRGNFIPVYLVSDVYTDALQ